jgi:hypothetical protein
MINGYVLGALVVFCLGVWIGVGAPGWPWKPDGGRRHLEKRAINPIAWGRTPGRERPRPRVPGERRIRLR